MKLNIAETFISIQGEGHLTGKRMFFIRFGGCTVRECALHPVNLGLCDENWRTMKDMDIDQLVSLAKFHVGKNGWVCITGGEPTDQPDGLSALCDALAEKEVFINLQTSGTKPVGCYYDWLTVSPKGLSSLKQKMGSELKLVYMNQEEWVLRDYFESTNFELYQLQPLWDGDKCTNMEETIDIVHRMNQRGIPYDISLQTHKLMGVK